MAPPNTQLPLELVSQIIFLGDPSPAGLAALSKVCHLWYRIIFPTLYSTVYLSWDAPIFAARIMDEHIATHYIARTSTSETIRPFSVIDGLRVVDYVQALVLDGRLQREQPIFHQQEFDIMRAAFPLLKGLKRIDWGLSWLPSSSQFFRDMSHHCRSIEHVSFEIPDHVSLKTNAYNGEWIINDLRYISDNDFTAVFSFSNLKYIRLKDTKLPHDPDTNGHIAPSLVAMILRSPNLEHLELELQENPDDDGFMSFGWLVEAIAPVLNHTFHHLRVFRLSGTASIDSEYFLRLEETNLIRSFLFRHPQLHTLQLPWDWDMNFLIDEPLEDSPQALKGALPSLRHFEGPTYLCIVILQLDIAQNLEHLGILDASEDEESDLLGFVTSFPQLPNLRRLEFMSTYMLDNESFSGVLDATPNITELTVHWVDGDPDVTRQGITKLQHLRKLTFGFNVLPHLANRLYKRVSAEQETAEVFELARQCPSLVLLRVLPEEYAEDSFDYMTSWHIERHSNGLIDVSFSSLPKLPMISKEPMFSESLVSNKSASR
ncbi:hypothetical protein BDV93DRAFT_593387 [Ceratobasidium sp. AG-I]|nr:hypothetical protein BDV93DRAFT_593387 [Ceratobasidium sp. AG-I]